MYRTEVVIHDPKQITVEKVQRGEFHVITMNVEMEGNNDDLVIRVFNTKETPIIYLDHEGETTNV